MSVGLAIFLGIIQGLTEFLPVSSSGHLALFGNWFGMAQPDLTFDVLVHVATLAAIVVYFRKDWIQLANQIITRQFGDMPRMVLLYLILSMIPAGLVGVFLKEDIMLVHHHNAWVGVCLMITGATLLLGLRTEEGEMPYRNMTWAVLIAMSLAQAVAILPGISRSGATIMAGVFAGMQRKDCARFSFLMAVPVIGGAGLLTLKDVYEQPTPLPQDLWLSYGAGFAAALISGFIALAFLMKLLEGRNYFRFGFYCIGLGLLAIIL